MPQERIQSPAPMGVGQPGSPAQGGGGGYGWPTLRRAGAGEVPEPFFRDDLDFERSMYRRVPYAEYPDGYLGTLRTRRDDRLMQYVQSRINQRQYQRGVHKGERIDPQDYFWPDEFNPQSGLMYQAAGMRQSPSVDLAARYGLTDRQMIPRGARSLMSVDPTRRTEQLQRLAPPWR